MRKPKQTEEIFLTDIKDPNAKNFVQPLYVALAEEVTTTRRNISSTKDRTDKYANIENGIVPYTTGRGKGNGGNIEIRDAVILCQKAYYNIPIFTNVINLMGEFSNGKIYWKDGSAKSREFFAALFDSLGIWNIQDQFYREFYRSGNVFEYRFDGKVKEDDLKRLTQVYGTEITAAAKKGKLPIRYVLLNPADIQLTGTMSFAQSQYFKTLSDYELQRLRKPNTLEEKEFFDSLPAKTKAEIKAGGGVLLPLEPEKLKVIFYKKQDYEPFSIPMGFGVLADINWKEEMKRIDMAVSRTMQQVILLITMGESPKDGGLGVNQDNLNAMRNLFSNQSVGRVLVSDFTTKAQWLIPDIANFLNPVKYTIVNQDIQVGLNYVLFGEEKFANQQIKVQVFIERLKEGRNAFINNFLLPEVKRIAEEWGFKNYPTPYYEDINLKDDLQFGRLYVQMVQYGILTPEEGIEAIQTNKLPTAEESLASQEELKKLKDKGFYQPIMGGPAAQMDILKEQNKQAEKTMQRQQEHDEKTQKRQLKHDAENPVTPAPSIHINAPTKSMPAPNGRPSGTKSPQSTKNVKPIGASYSLSKIKDNMILASALQEEVGNKLKGKNKELNSDQLEIVKEITHLIVANEEPKDWLVKAEEYIKLPVDKNPDRIKQIQDIAFEHSLDDYLASILFASVKND